jgi:hypothetical protein
MLFKKIKKLEKEVERLNDLIEKKWSKEELQIVKTNNKYHLYYYDMKKNRDWEKIN